MERKYGETTFYLQGRMDKENEALGADANADEDGDDEDDDDDETHTETRPKGKRNRPLTTLFWEFDRWKKQMPVVGFNSSKYDINAMKSALFPALLEATPRGEDGLTKMNVIKKLNTYMAVTTDKLKIVDILNFLSPNTSLDKFLKSFKVSGSKGCFPYEWFTDLGKLQHTMLPPYEDFYSQLKNTNISTEEYTRMQQIWKDEHMTTMRDFLVWYNNQDVQPFMEAIDKMCAYFASRGLDLFKDGISLPGLAMKDLFAHTGTFFTLFKKRDADLYHTMREQIVGGPSIIFNRYQEKDKTCIRKHQFESPKKCEAVMGFDANALYLWSLMQPMPTGFYNRRREENNFRLEQSFPREHQAREWLMWKQHADETNITHRHKDGHEISIGPRSIPVDGYSKELHKIYQFQGCLFHGHECWITKKHQVNPITQVPMATLREKTEQTTTYLKQQGYHVEEIYECQWKRAKSSNPEIRTFVDKLHANAKWTVTHRKKATLDEMLRAIKNNELFGIVECDIHVPASLREEFDEMPPIFKNTMVDIDDIGDHMKSFAEAHDLMKKARRMTIGSLFGEKIMLISPLLKWYLEHGLVCTKIYQVIEYTPLACFEKAGQRVSNARRQGDSDPDKSIIAEMEKLFGNSYYGKTVTNKEKHTSVGYYSEQTDVRKLDKCISRNSFIGLTQMDQDTFEVVSAPHSIKLDLPIQVGFFVYGYAKLRMLEFYYDFMVKAFNQSDFEYCEMDTDSAYIAFSSADWKSLMKPSYRKLYEEYMANAHTLGSLYMADSDFSWFPRECCEEHSQYDKRTPGLFKLEWSGDGIVGLCSKTYFCFGAHGDKHSCKGIQQKRNQLQKEHYLNVLTSRQSGQGVNRGFRVVDNHILTYEQVRSGLSYFYPKRKVLPDGVSTMALTI